MVRSTSRRVGSTSVAICLGVFCHSLWTILLRLVCKVLLFLCLSQSHWQSFSCQRLSKTSVSPKMPTRFSCGLWYLMLSQLYLQVCLFFLFLVLLNTHPFSSCCFHNLRPSPSARRGDALHSSNRYHWICSHRQYWLPSRSIWHDLPYGNRSIRQCTVHPGVVVEQLCGTLQKSHYISAAAGNCKCWRICFE